MKISFTLKPSFLSITNRYTSAIANSSILAVSVAIAAPCIPNLGAPRFPNISTQFKNTFVQNDTIDATTETLSTSMLLNADITVLLMANVKYA